MAVPQIINSSSRVQYAVTAFLIEVISYLSVFSISVTFTLNVVAWNVSGVATLLKNNNTLFSVFIFGAKIIIKSTCTRQGYTLHIHREDLFKSWNILTDFPSHSRLLTTVLFLLTMFHLKRSVRFCRFLGYGDENVGSSPHLQGVLRWMTLYFW